MQGSKNQFHLDFQERQKLYRLEKMKQRMVQFTFSIDQNVFWNLHIYNATQCIFQGNSVSGLFCCSFKQIYTCLLISLCKLPLNPATSLLTSITYSTSFWTSLSRRKSRMEKIIIIFMNNLLFQQHLLLSLNKNMGPFQSINR